MSSKFAPPAQVAPLKFGEFDITAQLKPMSNGGEYYEFIAYITSPEPTDQIKQRKMYSFTEDYRKVTWPSIEAMITAKFITSPDDIFIDLGQPSKKFYACYRTPMYLIVATPKDIAENRATETDDKGRACKPAYPIKFEKIFATQEDYNNAYLVHKTTQPVQAPPSAPVANPDYQAILDMLPAIISNVALDLSKLENALSHDPFTALQLTLQSKEVRHEVAKAVITKTGPTDDNAIKGLLLSLNGGGYLDIESAEIKAARENVPF